MKKLISILVVLVLIFLASMGVFATAETEQLQRMNREKLANEQYQMLLMNLSAEAASNIGRSISSDYYGGAYLNDDGNLVVCVTNEYDTDSNAIQAYTNNSEITTKAVDYAYTELKRAQDMITEAYMLCSDTSAEKNSAETKNTLLEILLSSFRGTYIDEERNTLVVMIAEITDEEIKAFQNVFSSAEFLEFVEGYNVTTTASSWKPGSRI